MDSLEIPGTKTGYPQVNFSYETGICSISGESFQEDIQEYYKKLTDWLFEYTNLKKPCKLIIDLSYFNTASTRGLLDLLLVARDYYKKGGEVIIEWHYGTGDEDMMLEIDDMAVDLEMDIIKIENKK
jgi:hypothetical protein